MPLWQYSFLVHPQTPNSDTAVTQVMDTVATVVATEVATVDTEVMAATVVDTDVAITDTVNPQTTTATVAAGRTHVWGTV